MESARWSFGDNTYLTYEPYVVHQYSAPGTYDVELKIRRLDGAYDSYTRRLVVSGSEQAPNIDIIKQSEWFNLGDTIQLAANFSAGAASDKTIYRWSLGDQTIIKGQGDNFKTIAHSYLEPEDKNIRLTVTGENGLTATVDSFMRHNKFAPEIDDIKVYGLEAPAPVKLGLAPGEHTRDLDGNLSHFIYEFGDNSPNVTSTDGFLEHDYAQPGSYLVAVTAVDITGLSTRFEKQIVVKENQAPVITHIPVYGNTDIPAPVTLGFAPHEGTVDDQGIQRWIYSFGDGSEAVETSSGYLEHEFQSSGVFSVLITAIDPFGLSATYSFGLEIKQNQVPILSNFNLVAPNEPAPVLVSVDASAFASDIDGYITSYEYSWGDGLVEQNDSAYASHTYLYSGRYTVSVRVLDDKGSWSEPVFKEINISENLAPISEITRVSGFDYAPALLSFTGSQSKDTDGQVSAYHWAVSDGRFFDGPEVSINFNSAGTYELSLQVVDDKGGIGTTSLTLNIVENNNPVANFDILKNSVFTYEVFELDASSSFDPDVDQILDYEWIDSAGQRYYGQKIYPFLSAPGVYSFTLTVKDRVGGSASISKNILVESSTLPAPLAAIEVKGGIGTNGGYVGEVLFYADDSSGNGSEIASYEWSFSDGSIYTTDFVRKNFEAIGEYTVTLTIITVDGRANRKTLGINVEGLINPKLVETVYSLVHSGFDTTSFNPLSINANFSLDVGFFSLSEPIELLVNGNIVSSDYVSVTQENLAATFSLDEGVNKISIVAFDERSNKVEKHYVVWAGDKTLSLNLRGADGLVPEKMLGTIKLEENVEVSLDGYSDSDGKVIFKNIPNENLIFTALSSGIAFLEFIKKSDENVTLISKEVYQEQLNSDNLDFSQGLDYWSVESTNNSISIAEDSILVSMLPGHQFEIERAFVANESGFAKFKGDAAFIESKGIELIMVHNITSGEACIAINKYLGASEADHNDCSSVLVRPNDVIHLKKNISVKENKYVSSYNLLASDAYAAGGATYLQNKYSYARIFPYKESVLEKSRPSQSLGLDLYPIEHLSIIDFEKVNETVDFKHQNSIYIELGLKSIHKIMSANVTTLSAFQKDVSIAKRSEVKTNIFECDIFSCAEVIAQDGQAIELKLSKEILPEVPVVIVAAVKLKFADGEESSYIFERVFSPSSFLFKHNATSESSHYDANSDSHFNLSESRTRDFNDLGDFWSRTTTVKLIDLFKNANPNFKVGDVSNINGGGFEPHKGHIDGLSFDAKTKYYGGVLTFSENTIDELDRLLSDTKIQPLFSSALAYISDEAMIKKVANFCSSGRTINNYIINRLDKNDHKDHWHFNVAASPVEARIPKESLRPKFKLLGTNSDKTLRHPSYPDYSYIMFEDFYKYDSGKEIKLGRVAFKLVDKVTDKTLYESYLDEKLTEYIDDFITLKVVKDGSGKDAIVYKVKTESLQLIQDVNELPEYELVATAISDTTNYVDYCNAERVKLLDVIDDCNNDGIADDPAFLTTEGGGIGFHVNFSPLHVIGGDARVCGASTIDDDAKVLIYDGAIIENSYIGPACSGVIIQGDVKIKGNSSICEDYLVQGEAAGFVDIMGDAIRVNNSRLSGDILIESNATIDNQSKITGSSVYVARSILNKVTIWGGATLTDSYVGDTDINGMLGDQDSNFSSRLQLQDTSVFNADLSGNGLINGFINTGGRFEGYGSFQMPTYTAVLHLFPSGGIFRNGLAKGNGYIAGFIQDGGIGEFYSTTYFRSGIFSNASIGANGFARCHFLVQGGQLNGNICHQVYNGSRYPTVMNLDDWLAGKSWPTP